MSESSSLLKRMLRPLMINEVETGKSAWYPELQPRVYDRDLQEAFDAACAVVDRHPRRHPESDNPEQMRLDVEVHTERVGRGDIGQDARTILDFFDRMDRVLG